MNGIRLVVLLAAFVACRPTQAPTVRLHLVDPAQWTAEDLRFVEAVGSVWSRLGLSWEITESTDRAANACSKDWPDRASDCVIDVGLYRKGGMRATGIAGYSDRATNESWIDSSLTGYALLRTLAHEVGHQVLDTLEHVVGPGIMNASSADWEPSDGDHDLACRTIKRACR